MRKIAVSLVLLVAVASTALAQKGKIGYCNVDYILANMPDTKRAENELKTYKNMLDAQMKTKVQEFQTKYEAYEKSVSTMPPSIRETKEKELQRINDEIESYGQKAEIDLQNKQLSLMQPILDKVNKAIKDVALENGYEYIFSKGQGGLSIILYAPEQNEVSNLILKKLGVTPPANSN